MAMWLFHLSVKRSLLTIFIFLKYFLYQPWISARSRKYTDLLSANPPARMQIKSEIIKVPSSLKIDFARTCLCLISKLSLSFLQTGTCSYRTMEQMKWKFCQGCMVIAFFCINYLWMHGSLMISGLILVHVLKFPDSSQSSSFRSF